jgi:hypothetical protein
MTPVRFSCFINAGPDPPPAGAKDWIVAPSFHFQIGATIPLRLVGHTRFRGRFLADYPILWVEDPATAVWYPFWAGRGQALLFGCLIAGRPPPRLPPLLTDRLVDAGILVSRSRLKSQRRKGEALAEEARASFDQRRYCLLPSLVRKTHALALGRYYRDQIAHGDWARGDEQVRLRYGQHNETMSRFFHHQLTDFVGRVAGEPVRPSYTYVSAYQEGAVLRPHVDRKQCIFTLSLCIASSQSIEGRSKGWPLWFQAEEGKVSITQEVGDAVLFRGCELPHWRDRPSPAAASTTLLFHYVPRDFADVLD